MNKSREMKTVIQKILRRGFDLKNANALELYGREGNWHTVDYASYVNTLEIWEIDPIYLDNLKLNLPKAKIKITDNFTEIQHTSNKYDFIVVDNPQSIYGDKNQFCEHFEIFPYIYRIIDDSAVVILNINIKPYGLEQNKPYLDRRNTFYQLEDAQFLSPFFVRDFYKNLFEKNGFLVEWLFFHVRNSHIYYFVIKLRKMYG